MNLHQQRHQATHEALRRVALERFARDGFANVTVSQLATEAGVTERTTFGTSRPRKRCCSGTTRRIWSGWQTRSQKRPPDESLFDAVLASVVSSPHDLEVVRQAALVRAELIGGERAAGHLRVVQASFAAVITEFVRSRYCGCAGHRSEGGSGRGGAGGGTGCGGGELGPRRMHRRPRPNRRGQRESGAIRARTAELTPGRRDAASR